MKKNLIFVVFISFFVTNLISVEALTLSEARKQIGDLKTEILKLRSKLGAQATPPAKDPTPRIAYFPAKVNQYVDDWGNWTSDPDGSSGATINRLTYCKKWYPNSVSVSEYKEESIPGWLEIGNVGEPATYNAMSYECVQDSPPSVDVKVNGSDTPTGVEFKSKMVISWTSENAEYCEGFSTNLLKWGTNTPWGTGHPGVAGLSGSHEVMAASSPSQDIRYVLETTPLRVQVKCWRNGISTIDEVVVPLTFPSPTPTITVTSPNGGETFTAGQQMTVRWNTQNILGTSGVKIEMKSQNGTLINLTPNIDETTNNDGVQTFTVNSAWPSSTYKILITSFAYPNVADLSDNFFTINPVQQLDFDTITPYITVIKPEGGKTYLPSQLTYIETKFKTNESGYYGKTYQLINSSGSVVSTILNQYPALGSGAGAYLQAGIEYGSGSSVNSFGNVPSGEYKIHAILSKTNGTVKAASDSLSFTINSPASSNCTVQSFTANPTNVPSGESATLSWSTNGCVFVNIDNPYLQPATGTQTSMYTETKTHTLRAASTIPAGCTSLFGYSSTTSQSCGSSSIEKTVTVTVVPTIDPSCGATGPRIKVISPNGGEIYQPGQAVTVNWESCYFPSTANVRIDLLVAPFSLGGTNGYSLANTPNDGTEIIILPSISAFNGNPMNLGNNFKISIWEAGTGTLYDLSDDLFTIAGTNLPSGCTSTLGYSSTTGVSCTVPTSFPSGCSSAKGYSAATGQSCNWAPTVPGVPQGCTSTAGFSITTGVVCRMSGVIQSSGDVELVGKYQYTRQLRYGAVGEDVRNLQKEMTAEGVYTGPTNGKYGPLTMESVRKLQQKYKLPAVGMVGPKTLELLNR